MKILIKRNFDKYIVDKIYIYIIKKLSFIKPMTSFFPH